jgi:hypothetical protein
MKRHVPVAVVSALLVGVGVGAFTLWATQTPRASAGATPSDLRVVWSWDSKPQKGTEPTRLESGSLQGDPGHGFVLVETAGKRPALFSAPAGTGAFHPVSNYYGDWAFRAGDGSLALVTSYDQPALAPTFTFLAWKGDHRTHTAVAFVEQLKYWPGWKLDGYLPGFSLPQGLPRERELQRPLLGADGHLYVIDSAKHRLVRQDVRGSSESPRPKWGCSTWPAPNGASYEACQNSVVRHDANGASATVFQRSQLKDPFAAWNLVQQSPDGKWLLLEDSFGACGIATWADFLPSGGGQLQSAFADATSSQALGWLPDSTALVSVQTSDCAGAAAGGVYEVWPGNWTNAPELVFAGDVFEASTWGYR